MVKKRKEVYDRDDIARSFSLLITNPKFLKQFLPHLDPKLFEQPELRWMTNTVVKYCNEMRETDLSFTILASMLRNDKSITEEEREIITPFIVEMEAKRPKSREVEYFTNQFEQFIKRCFVSKILQEAMNLFNKGNTEDAENIILKMKMPSAFREDVIFAPDNFNILFKMQSDEERAKTIPTGIKKMDEVLDGGLMPGEEGVVMAPLGYGKSMTLVAFGAHAWLKGKHVVHFSFENSAKETLARYLANMTGVPRHELLAEGEDSETLNYAVRRSKESGGIIAIERLIGSLTNIRRLEAALIGIENQYDIKADLVIIDYGDLMVPLKSASGRKYEDMQAVFSEIRDLAASCEVPIWTATQTNRTGLEAKRVKTSHISDSLGKAMTADIILGFSRPQKDADADPGADITGDVAEFQILKNRRGEEPKIPFKAVTNFALAKFDVFDDEHATEIQDAKDESAQKHNRVVRGSKTQKEKHGK